MTTATTLSEAGTRPPDATHASFARVRRLTDALSAPLGPEDQVVQSMDDASPTKWHRAHTTWFFEEFVLTPSIDGYRPFDEEFRFLFNSYYEAVGPRQPRPRRGMITRPDAARVGDYRHAVDAAMDDALRSGTLDEAALDLVELGLHHEQQHQELLLMDAKHLLWQNPLRPAYSADWGLAGASAEVAETHRRRRTDRVPGPAGLIEHDGGLVHIGHSPGEHSAGFAYDNESPRHRHWLEPFAIEDRLITCGEWLEFMDDGGYERAELWLSDGWHIACEQQGRSPLYWEEVDGTWRVFTLGGSRPLDPGEPVTHVSYHEADAFARWRGARLPTESEWEAVASPRWTPARRGAHPTLHPAELGAGGADPCQLTGEVWQWTSSAYLPYPGFSPAPGAVGEYNGKFMVDQHVLRGGSCATPPGHERPTYRNFFPPASRWAFSGVRIAHDSQ